jgi:alkylhydroperoxidase/carboxymuconolactone decarboxylase family protein YurZ
MDEDEMISRGMEVFEECYRGVVPMPPVDAREFSGMTMKMFNDFWGDGRLSFREKRLIVLGILAGSGADPSLFSIHTKSALRNGELSADEARAVVLMALPYVGFAKASPIFVATEALIAEESKQETVTDAAAPPS